MEFFVLSTVITSFLDAGLLSEVPVFIKMNSMYIIYTHTIKHHLFGLIGSEH
jgi:hypothetical protein